MKILSPPSTSIITFCSVAALCSITALQLYCRSPLYHCSLHNGVLNALSPLSNSIHSITCALCSMDTLCSDLCHHSIALSLLYCSIVALLLDRRSPLYHSIALSPLAAPLLQIAARRSIAPDRRQIAARRSITPDNFTLTCYDHH